jgi:hypothetical protein
MRITSRQDAIIIGSLLGDGCLEKNGRFTRLRLEHGHVQKSYLEWKYKELKGLMTGSVMKVHYYNKTRKLPYDSYRAYTFSDKAFDIYRNNFYVNNKKIIPANLALFLKHPLSLAIWFMDDGYKRNDCNALRLSTDSFTKDEQYILQSVLKNNFGIETSVHKKGKYWNIYIPERESKKFIALIKRYVIPELSYKITLTP